MPRWALNLSDFTLNNELAPAQPGDSVLANGKCVGTVTSAGWGHRIGHNIALAFVDPKFASLGKNLHVLMLGREVDAVVDVSCRYEPENQLVG